MINVDKLLKLLKEKKISFFTGVPDSVLKKLSSKIDKFPTQNTKLQ